MTESGRRFGEDPLICLREIIYDSLTQNRRGLSKDAPLLREAIDECLREMIQHANVFRCLSGSAARRYTTLGISGLFFFDSVLTKNCERWHFIGVDVAIQSCWSVDSGKPSVKPCSRLCINYRLFSEHSNVLMIIHLFAWLFPEADRHAGFLRQLFNQFMIALSRVKQSFFKIKLFFFFCLLRHEFSSVVTPEHGRV